MSRPPTPSGRFYKLFYLWSSAAIYNPSNRTSIHIKHRPWRPTEAKTLSHNLTICRNFTASRVPGSISTTETETQTLPAQMRHLMRRVPHPVVILTATHPPSRASHQTSKATRDTSSKALPQPSEANFRGMTISSFNTVCLEPRPIVSFNMKLPSRTHDALKANEGYFLVHLLTDGHDGAALADSFTRGQEEVHRVLGSGLEAPGDGGGPRSGSVTTVVDEATRASPMMVLGGAISCVLRCRLLEGSMRVEDHVVLCAEVFGMVSAEDEVEKHADGGDGLSLVYVDRAFRHVGPVIDWRRQR